MLQTTSMSCPVLFALVAAALAVIPALAQQPKCVCYEEISNSLISVTEIEPFPDGSGRLFVAEQAGLVYILGADDIVVPQPFMNLSQSVFEDLDRGFLSVAFHPDFLNNDKFYVLHSVNTPDARVRLSEFLVSSTDPNLADMASERIVYEFYNVVHHNGGDMVFGVDDGMLYLCVGDGSGEGDPTNEAQSKGSALGKVLRIDVDSRTGNLQYGIPSDNPFISDPEAVNNTEIYSYGFRNPWRMTLDYGNRTTQAGRGRIFLADVGQWDYEEVDLILAGGNYGWAFREGPMCYKDLYNCPEKQVCVTDATEVCPIMYYHHNTTGQSIIGGHVYRGCVNPDYEGWYFFADFLTPTMFRMIESETSPGVWEMATVPTCASCSAQDFVGYPYTIGRDSNGELYLTTGMNPFISESKGPDDHIYRMYDPDYVANPPCPVP